MFKRQINYITSLLKTHQWLSISHREETKVLTATFKILFPPPPTAHKFPPSSYLTPLFLKHTRHRPSQGHWTPCSLYRNVLYPASLLVSLFPFHKYHLLLASLTCNSTLPLPALTHLTSLLCSFCFCT